MVTSNLKKEIEDAIKASIIRRFSISVREVSLVMQPTASILVALEHQRNEEKDFDEQFKVHVRKLMALFEIPNPKIIIQREETAYPSPLIILQTIKILAPISVEALSAELRKVGYDLSTDEWVRQRLDTFRKQQFTSRREDGQYVLTYHGLVTLGSQRNRRSTDVRRALEMAKWKD